ncbi:MAG: hypothetical protein K7J15_06465, partial [Candidatus Regiella insecticola]|nr:hypothetical protein [Candidatus Regiella insecticola]
HSEMQMLPKGAHTSFSSLNNYIYIYISVLYIFSLSLSLSLSLCLSLSVITSVIEDGSHVLEFST